MNGFTEPLPGLLDDPQFQIPNLPTLPDVRIAPLRNPAPIRHGNAPLPLEPLTKSSEDHRHGTRNTSQLDDEPEKISPPRLRPSDVLLAREAKKPHLAISELLETSNDADTQHLQLPSFVSLAVVENSPIQESSRLSPNKRLRLDLDVEISSRDVGRRLPRPAQKDENKSRPVPLLPAMVTGLHEPPPSAGILPSMEIDARPNLARTSTTSKMQVKDILAEARHSTHVPPEAMLNTPDLPTVELSKPYSSSRDSESFDIANDSHLIEATTTRIRKDCKIRRVRRKWSEEETADLLAGVKKHGFGKWKQILTDIAYTFQDRTSIDLKDRYRVFLKDHPDTAVPTLQPQQEQAQSASNSQEIGKGKEADIVLQDSVAGPVSNVKPKRKRRPWTHAEDAALIRGVAQYGFQWTTIHDDLDLELAHRRATDLRDRIRNLYPEGYKQAEARPLRSETKKLDKTGTDTLTTTPDARLKTSQVQRMGMETISQEGKIMPNLSTPTRRNNVSAKLPKSGTDVQQVVEQVGVTLPPLALDDGEELDWANNTLPPLIEWEEIGM